MDNDLSSKVIVICCMKVRVLDSIMSNVKHASKLGNLISFHALDNLDYNLSTKNSIINIKKGALRRKDVKTLYSLIKKTSLGFNQAMKSPLQVLKL